MNRLQTILIAAPLTLALASCATSGAGVETGSCAVITETGGCSFAPTTPTTPVQNAVTLLTETVPTTYQAIGGSMQFVELVTPTGTRAEELKSALAPADSKQLSVTYDPATSNFRIVIQQPGVGVGIDNLYDDPLYRTAFGNLRFPQAGTPNLPNFAYLQKGPVPSAPNDILTFFYETPGTHTRFVTLAGFVRNTRSEPSTSTTVPTQGDYTRQRSVFVFGTPSAAGRVPVSGTATYTGGLLASVIYNTEIDTNPTVRSRTEWISGTSTITVNFAQNTIDLALSGSFTNTRDAFEGSTGGLANYNSSNAGRTFTAAGRAAFGTARPYFSGTITAASVGGSTLPVAVGTVAGSMFGNRAEEVGGNFRIVGGGSDQRVEILGAFTGKQ
jgi:hypothetical protein